jgi:hypothetical protein
VTGAARADSKTKETAGVVGVLPAVVIGRKNPDFLAWREFFLLTGAF